MAFYVRLRKFFQKNDPHRLYMVKKIMTSFRNDEDVIMDRLDQIYSQGGPSTLTSTGSPKRTFSYNDTSNNYSTPSNADNTSMSNEDQEHKEQFADDTNSPSAPVKKSKKKLIILILLAIVLVTGGYFGYDYFMKDTPKTEESDKEKDDKGAAAVEEPEEAVKEETKKEEPQPIAISDSLTDTIQSTDSIELNLNVESADPAESDEESDNE